MDVKICDGGPGWAVEQGLVFSFIIGIGQGGQGE